MQENITDSRTPIQIKWREYGIINVGGQTVKGKSRKRLKENTK
jgi:hypothetical protein